MKRTKYRRTIGSKEERIDSPELSKEINCGTRASSSPNGNVCYHLRSRTILYVDKCENRDESAYDSSKNVAISQPPPILETDHCNESKYYLTSVFTENFRDGRDIFSQQLQTSIRDISECEPIIKKFPNEVLTMIFSYLNVRELSISVAPVCKRWYIIAHSPILWRKLCLKGGEISTEDAKCLLTKSPLLSELIISNRKDIEELLGQLCRTNQRVESVAIKRCSTLDVLDSWNWALLHARFLNRLIKCCPKIRNLKLNEVCIRSDKFYNDLGILLPNLTCLHLSHSHYLQPRHIKNIATKCCSLARLWLSGESRCGKMEEWGNAYQTLFQQRWRTLTHLQFDASRLMDHVLKDLSLCINLKMLHFHRATYLRFPGLQAVGTLPNLISLRLHKSKYLCSTTLFPLFQTGNLGSLVNLSLAECTHVSDECAATIALHCSQLHLLSLALVEGITDKGIETILKHCSSLHYLDIYGMKNVTGSSFSYISQYAHKLNFLVIEELCNDEKEEYVKEFLALVSNVKVYRTHTWKTGGTYKCRLLQ